MEEQYPFIHFVFNLLFKVKIKAQMKTGSKNIFPFAWEQTEIINSPGCYTVKNQI